jgi:hypothetical protein
MFYFSCLWVFGVAGKSSVVEATISQNAARRRRRHATIIKAPRRLKNLHRQHNQSKSKSIKINQQNPKKPPVRGRRIK